MCKYIVSGGNKIEGKLNIRGAKNSILPIMATTILNENKSIICKSVTSYGKKIFV